MRRARNRRIVLAATLAMTIGAAQRAAVPEPAARVLAGLGGVGLIGTIRRRTRA